MWPLKLFILLMYLREATFQSSCEKHMSCTDCILDQNGCAWCAKEEINGSRCMPESTARERCPEKLQAPKGGAVEDKTDDFAGKEFHLVPQKYNLKLRPGQPVTFDFVYKITKNNPVDVYFLIDASKSMNSIKNQTADQSENIYKALNNMTNDVKLGFGTFVDKNALPYTKLTDSSKTYSFKHHLNLTENYGTFEEQLKKYGNGENLDAPEGGLDAICQAIACKDVIGWRNTSTKIIVYLSDGAFHTAGDGRMAGIFTPYDGKCYTVDNVYTKELEMDYPTIGMVNKLALENEIIILFAVPYNNILSNAYKVLSGAISGSKLTFINGSSADPVLMKTLSGIYKNITTVVNLKVNMKSGRRKNFNITFDPDCSRDLNKNEIDGACKLKPDTDREFKFTGTIALLEYQGIDDYVIDIAVEGFSDKLSLDVKVIKKCDCESEKNASKYCNGEILECGICKCSNGKYGEKCKCLAGSSDVDDNSTCFYNNKECSGNGHCDCGLCKCKENYEGRHCECSKTSCEMSHSEPCGGVGRGKCECGKCTCDSGFVGKACECDKNDPACRRTFNEQVCSGRGYCNCGKCKCDNISWDKRIQDSYCTTLPYPNGHNLQCSYVKSCVLCILNTNITCPCEGLDIEEVSIKDMDNKNDWNTCSNIGVDVGCYTKFLYKYNDDEHKIWVQFTKEKDCTASPYIICGAVLGSLLLIGILTLIIWKVTTELSYRREYSKFVEAHKEDLAGTCENPLYESPTTYFRNPAFRQRSVN